MGRGGFIRAFASSQLSAEKSVCRADIRRAAAELAVLRGHEGRVASGVFDAFGARVLTASEDPTARLWDAGSGAQLAVLRGHERQVQSAVFDPAGRAC